MARPRKTKKIYEEVTSLPADPLPPEEESVILDQVVKLDDLSRANLCRLDAEVRAARNQYMLQQLQLAEHIRSIDKDGKFLNMQASLHATGMHMQAMEARYNALRQEVEQKMGINLKDYSFDDETGILHKIQPVTTAPNGGLTGTST